MNITDFFDLSLLSQVMTEWSKATGMATIAMDADNNYISERIGFNDFCKKYTRGTKEGLRRCIQSDSCRQGVYYCHAGLMDFSMEIRLDDGTYLGKIIGGQILSSKPDYDKFIQLARELGIDQDEYLAALDKIQIRSEESIRASAYLLGRVVNLLVNSEYIKKKQANLIEQLDEENKKDPLTQLYNKVYCKNYMEMWMRNKTDVCLALFLIDVDNFKDVNDVLGHLAGDQVLKRIADILTGIFRQTDVVGRFGGDEYMVLMRNALERSIVENKAQEICEQVQNLVLEGYEDARFSVSIGIALYPQHGENYEVLMQNADMALYQVKNHGKRGYGFFA